MKYDTFGFLHYNNSVNGCAEIKKKRLLRSRFAKKQLQKQTRLQTTGG